MQETADHLLYPNPASQMVSDEHLQYFEFFGKILGKVCFYVGVYGSPTSKDIMVCTRCLVLLADKFVIILSCLTKLID